jgi:hypothetical protein
MVERILAFQTEINPIKSFGNRPPIYRLKVLQNNDVFFSSHSYRAGISKFLGQESPTPLVFNFAHPADSWDRFVPSQRHIILVSPQSQPATELEVQQFCGVMVQPALHHSLRLAYQSAGLKPQSLSWALQNAETLEILNEKNPMKAGYQVVEHPLINLLMRTAAHLVSLLFGLKVTVDHHLEFPNGKKWPLTHRSWKDSDGRPARLYQVKALPDGTWMKVSAFQSDMIERKGLFQNLTSRINKLELAGKARDVESHLLPSLAERDLFQQTALQ